MSFVLADPSMTKETEDYRIRGQGGCFTVDFDTIFDESPTLDDYKDDSPCEQCVKRSSPTIECTYDENGNCEDCTLTTYGSYGNWDGEESSSPHGTLSWERTLCSRVVIYRGVTCEGGAISYTSREVLRSRRRGALPAYLDFGGQVVCENPPKCNPGNRHECCQCIETSADGEQWTKNYWSRGTYRDCTRNTGTPPCDSLVLTDTPSEYGGPCHSCTELGVTPVAPLKHMVSPCSVLVEIKNGQGIVVGEDRRHLMGYDKISDDWWFFGTSEYDTFEAQLGETDPLARRPHVIVAHFEMKAKPLVCCGRTCPSCPDSGTQVGCGYQWDPTYSPCYNKIGRRCCECCKSEQYFKDPAKRQSKVRIVAAAGFTLECGSTDLQKLCDDWWEESQSGA